MTASGDPEPPERRTLASSCSPHLVALIGPARAGRLIIYAGAGISIESGLPTAAVLSERLHTRLNNLGFELSGLDPYDLLAVADAVGTTPGGLRALQNAALEAFNFEGAPASATHQALALLLLEGVVQVLTTNWDTCIERAASPERLMSVVTPEDRLQVQSESLLKVHGSAERPATLLVTTAQLSAPPVWASTTIAAALTSATVVFVGIGDVAPYVRLGLDQVVAELGQPNNVAVVSPSIDQRWDASQWSAVLPGLPPDRRWAMSAGEFAHGLLSAWINNALANTEVMARTLGLPQLPTAFDALHAVLRSHDAKRVCSWLRRSQMSPSVGKSVAHSDGASQVLLALALHSAASPVSSIPVHGPVRTPGSVLELLIAPDRTPGLVAADEAFRRAEEYRQTGELGPSEDLVVVCAGHTGPFHELQAGAPQNVVDDESGTIMSGGVVNLVAAGALLNGAAA